MEETSNRTCCNSRIINDHKVDCVEVLFSRESFRIEEKYVGLTEVQVANDSCVHQAGTSCDRCLCIWINKKIGQVIAREQGAKSGE